MHSKITKKSIENKDSIVEQCRNENYYMSLKNGKDNKMLGPNQNPPCVFPVLVVF